MFALHVFAAEINALLYDGANRQTAVFDFLYRQPPVILLPHPYDRLFVLGRIGVGRTDLEFISHQIFAPSPRSSVAKAPYCSAGSALSAWMPYFASSARTSARLPVSQREVAAS